MEKVLAPETIKEVDPIIIQEIRAENNAIKDLFKIFELVLNSIHHSLCENISQGNYNHMEKVRSYEYH